MPLEPYLWQTGDFLTANRLNSELRQTNGQPYLANGSGWHAQRPVYKSTLTFGQTQPATTGTWLKQVGSGTNGTWTPIIDSAAFLGGKGDLAAAGAWNPSGLAQGGGATGLAGGLSLYWTHQPFAAAASGASGMGIGPAGAAFAASPTHFGTWSNANANGFGGTPWALTIEDTATNLTGYWETSVAAPTGNTAGDGSGSSPRQHGLWASVYANRGHTVASIPTITTGYTGASALTSAGLNANIQQAMRLLNMPPLLNVTANATTTCANATVQVVNYPAASFDTYGGWTSGTGAKYTCPLPGLYLVAVFGGFDAPASGGRVRAGIQINGTNYSGPLAATLGGGPVAPSKVQIFSLNAGDTIQHTIDNLFNASAQTTSLGLAVPSMTILWLGAAGAPAPLPTVPDFTYAFQAGTPGNQMASVLNSYLANDLAFLIQKPYTLAYQTAAQAAFSNAVATGLSLQSNTGIVHGDSATSYGGWSTNTYTAPVNGWYLCVSEWFAATGANANDYFTGAFKLNPAGGGPDFYEQQVAWTGAGGGASAVGMYYLRAGDTITPCAYWRGHTGTLATDISVGKSHFEAVWVSA